MEKEEQKWEQEEVEQEQEEEETSLQVRKLRPVNETKSTESAIVETEKSNGTSERNGHEIQSTVTANGTKDFESTLENGEEKDELDGVVGNEEEISCPSCRKQFIGYKSQTIQCACCETQGGSSKRGGRGSTSSSNSQPDIIDVEFVEK